MQRRDFLKATTTVIAGATLAPRARASNPPLPADSSTDGRLVLPLNRNWRYSKSFVEGGHGREFDDSVFERVVIPHTNIRLPWHSFDDKSYEFVSLYRRRFRLPVEAKGKHVFIDFEGVMTASTVWINGVNLGEYKGGYTPFSFDLTPHLDFDGENVLAVDVDSTERPDIPPFGYQIDYLTFGGIYREVSLRMVPGTFIENIFAKPKDVLTPHPSLDVDCFLMSLEAVKGSARPRGRSAVTATRLWPMAPWRSRPGSAAPSPPSTASTWTISAPSNSGTSQLRTSIPCTFACCAEAEIVDSDTRTIGFREAQFTDHGFELNGKVIKLRGLDRHQTFPLCWPGDAGPRAAPRRIHSAPQSPVQYRPHFALSAVAPFSRCLR